MFLCRNKKSVNTFGCKRAISIAIKVLFSCFFFFFFCFLFFFQASSYIFQDTLLSGAMHM